MKRPAESGLPLVYQKYVNLVPGNNLLELLDSFTNEIADFFSNIDAAKHAFRYAEGKWTIKEVLLHIIDTERGYSYRAIMCVRGDDKTPLYPMDENIFALNADTTNRTMEDLIAEFRVVREGLKLIFIHTTEAQQSQSGNGVNGIITGRALGYIAVGHALHHKSIVQERYLRFP